MSGLVILPRVSLTCYAPPAFRERPFRQSVVHQSYICCAMPSLRNEQLQP
jgi:hypothetical protein